MDMEFLRGMENFDQVWMRVRGEPAPPAQPDGDVPACLRRRMDEKCAQAIFYSEAAERAGPQARGILLRLAGEERRLLRCLQLEYFLLTGACHRPAPVCARRDAPLQDLRLAWLGERSAAAQLRADAKACPPELREALEQIAAADERHAGTLHGLIKRAIVG